jgi:hypothetical protein
VDAVPVETGDAGVRREPQEPTRVLQDETDLVAGEAFSGAVGPEGKALGPQGARSEQADPDCGEE